MGDKRVVWIFTGSRSERGLLNPIIKRCEASPLLDTHVVEVNPRYSLSGITQSVEEKIIGEGMPDIVLIPTDRREMVPVAMTCFFAKIPTVHYLGGVFSYSATFDDVSRHVISLFSHVICVESEAAKRILVKSGEEPWRIIVTGTSHFDDLEIDTSLCPGEPYDLVLMNPTTIYSETLKTVFGRRIVVVGPNEDYASFDEAKLIDGVNVKVTLHPNVERPRFLGLLKNCRRFVSNSSATLYEAPYFGVEVVNPSIRNSERTSPDQKLLEGGSDKVVKLLCELDLKDPRLLAKRVRSPEWEKSIRLQKSVSGQQ